MVIFHSKELKYQRVNGILYGIVYGNLWNLVGYNDIYDTIGWEWDLLPQLRNSMSYTQFQHYLSRTLHSYFFFIYDSVQKKMFAPT